LDGIPFNLQNCILEYLGIRDIFAISAVNKAMLAASERDIVWNNLTDGEFSHLGNGREIKKSYFNMMKESKMLTTCQGEQSILQGHKDRVVKTSARKEEVMTVSKAGEIIVWNLQKRSSKRYQSPKIQSIGSVAWERNYIIAGADDGKIHVWDTNTGEYEYYSGHSGGIVKMRVRDKSNFVLTTSLDGTAKVSDFVNRKIKCRFTIGDPFTVTANEEFFAYQAQSGEISFHSWNHPKNSVRFHPTWNSTLLFLSNDSTVLVGVDDNEASIYDLDSLDLSDLHDQPISRSTSRMSRDNDEGPEPVSTIERMDSTVSSDAGDPSTSPEPTYKRIQLADSTKVVKKVLLRNDKKSLCFLDTRYPSRFFIYSFKQNKTRSIDLEKQINDIFSLQLSESKDNHLVSGHLLVTGRNPRNDCFLAIYKLIAGTNYKPKIIYPIVPTREMKTTIVYGGSSIVLHSVGSQNVTSIYFASNSRRNGKRKSTISTVKHSLLKAKA